MIFLLLCAACLVETVSGECITLFDEASRRSTVYCPINETLPNILMPNLTSSFPTQPPPTPLTEENITYFLYNRVTNSYDQFNDASYLLGWSSVKILFHGFMGSHEVWFNPPHTHLISALRFIEPNAAIMLVDWSGLASLFGGDWGDLFRSFNPYIKPVENVGIVAKHVAEFLESDPRIALADFHCIGFSLGAHVCGFIGKNLKFSRLGRISGLDPAGLGFDLPFPSDRLDVNDAEFVDVIHTSPPPLGLLRALGHVDFYVNDPTHPQPACLEKQLNSKDSTSVIDIANILGINSLPLPGGNMLSQIKRKRRNVGKQIDGWKNFISSFIKGIEWPQNDDLVSYLAGSPDGLANVTNVGDAILGSVGKIGRNKKNSIDANICSHMIALDLYTSSMLPSCRMEFCSCLSFISTQHPAYFVDTLTQQCTPKFCSDWRNRYLFGYWARPAPIEQHRYLHGSDICGTWDTFENQDARP